MLLHPALSGGSYLFGHCFFFWFFCVLVVGLGVLFWFFVVVVFPCD